jgi:hypothetical protein
MPAEAGIQVTRAVIWYTALGSEVCAALTLVPARMLCGLLARNDNVEIQKCADLQHRVP